MRSAIIVPWVTWTSSQTLPFRRNDGCRHVHFPRNSLEARLYASGENRVRRLVDSRRCSGDSNQEKKALLRENIQQIPESMVFSPLHRPISNRRQTIQSPHSLYLRKEVQQLTSAMRAARKRSRKEGVSGNSILSLFLPSWPVLVEYVPGCRIRGWGHREIAAKAFKGKNSTGTFIFSGQ